MTGQQALPRISWKPKEIAAMIGVDYWRVLDLIRAGQIPADRYGSTYRVPNWWVAARLDGPAATAESA